MNTFPGCSQRSAQEDGDSRRTQLPNTFPGDQAEKGLKFRCNDRLGSTSNINQQKTQTLQKSPKPLFSSTGSATHQMLLSFHTQTSHTAFYWSSQKRYAAAEEAHAETPFLAVLSAPHRKMVGLSPHATAKPLPWGPIQEGVEVPLQRPPGIHQQHQSTKDTDGTKTSQIFDFFYRQRDTSDAPELSHTRAFYWSSQNRYAAAEEAHAETPFLAVLSAPHRKMVGLSPHATAKPLPRGPNREGVEVPLQRPPGIHQQHQSTKDTDGAKTLVE